MTHTLTVGLDLAAYAVAAGRSAILRGDIDQANVFADRATGYLSGIDHRTDSEFLAEWAIEFDNRNWPAERRVPVMRGTRVDGYVSIAEITKHASLDVTSASSWSRVMSRKRNDVSYGRIISDLENGWGLKHAVGWTGKLGNGHHRVTAAYDLGYTSMPVVFDNWIDTGGND